MTIEKKKEFSTKLIPLTSKEQAVLEFIEVYMLNHQQICPSYKEICDHFGLSSFNSVQNYLKQLSRKGYLEKDNHHKRGLRLIKPLSQMIHNSEQEKKNFTQSSSFVFLPLMGEVSAGLPIEKYFHDEVIEVPRNWVRQIEKTFALKVKGNSMIEEGILNEDHLIIHQQEVAKNGDLVIASLEQGTESTVKRFYLKEHPESGKKAVELRPSNGNLKSFWYKPSAVQIRGLVISLFRKY